MTLGEVSRAPTEGPAFLICTESRNVCGRGMVAEGTDPWVSLGLRTWLTKRRWWVGCLISLSGQTGRLVGEFG